VIVETYHPAGSIDAAAGRIWRTILPVPVALLIALAAAQLPLGWYYTRRSRAEAAERERVARAAERALQAERGRIAAEVHRGVVQELAGVAYQLQATAITPPQERSEEDLRGLLGRGAAVCRRTMTVMRELLADQQPEAPAATPDLDEALRELAAPLRARGVEVTVATPPGGLPEDGARLVMQVARETLGSVQPGARTVRLEVAAEGGTVTLVVEDDGRAAGDGDRDGHRHAGMLRLADTFAARGGSLSIASERGRGTRISASLPINA
jgi:signal transduction histidine kinase